MFSWSKDGVVYVTFKDDDDLSEAQYVIFDPTTEKIEEDFFTGLEHLKDVRGKSIRTVGKSAFQSCEKLRRVDFPNLVEMGEMVCDGCIKLASFNLGKVRTIPESAFGYCKALTVMSSQHVTTIDKSAFEQCLILNFVDFPNVTSIGPSAFDTTSLKSCKFDNITVARSNAFLNCTDLLEIDLPQVNSIEEKCFLGCSNLSSVSAPVCLTLEEFAFAQCFTLETASFPLVNDAMWGCFSNCRSLVSISLPKVSTVSTYSFFECSSLENVNFPEVSEIHPRAFEECTLLKRVEFPAATKVFVGAFTDLDTGSFPSLKALEHLSFKTTESSLRVLYLPSLESFKMTNLDEDGNDVEIDGEIDDTTPPTKFPVLADLPDSFNPTPEEVAEFTNGKPVVFMYKSGRTVGFNRPIISDNLQVAEISLGRDPDGFKKTAESFLLALNRRANDETSSKKRDSTGNATDAVNLPRLAVDKIVEYIKPSFKIPQLSVTKLQQAGFDFVKFVPRQPVDSDDGNRNRRRIALE